MALINCPECNKQISDRAAACPDCACPIAAQPTATAGTQGAKVQTIEATGKKWKGIQVLAVFGMVISLIAIFSTSPDDSSAGYMGFWAFTCLISLLAVIFARVGAWWNHQ